MILFFLPNFLMMKMAKILLQRNHDLTGRNIKVCQDIVLILLLSCIINKRRTKLQMHVGLMSKRRVFLLNFLNLNFEINVKKILFYIALDKYDE